MLLKSRAGAVMLDLWQDDMTPAAPTPMEGTNLPSWWDLHEVAVYFWLIVGAVIGVLAIIKVIDQNRSLIRTAPYQSLLAIATELVRAKRRIATFSAKLQRDVNSRIDRS